MEYKNLTSFVLIILLVGLIAGTGVLILDKMGTSGGVTRSTGVLNESHACVAHLATTTYLDQGISGVSIGGDNLTGNITCATSGSVTCNYTSSTGVITVNSSMGATPSISVQYTYLANSSTTTAVHASRDAVAAVPEDWMSLIVTIGILAIILTLVLSAFAFQKRR